MKLPMQDYRQPPPAGNDFLQGIDGDCVSNSLPCGVRLAILSDAYHCEAIAMSNVVSKPNL